MKNLVIQLHILIGFKFLKQSTFLQRIVESIRFSTINDSETAMGQILLRVKSAVSMMEFGLLLILRKGHTSFNKKRRIPFI